MILAIGNINLDWICKVPHLPTPDEKVNIEHFNIFPGGAASNFAASLARLGSDVALFGHVGDDVEGRDALKSLREEGVDVSRVIVERNCLTGFVIILVGEEGQTVKLRFRGANAQLSPNNISPTLLKGIDIAYVASTSMPIAEKVSVLCKDMGIRSAIDVGGSVITQPLNAVREMIRNFSIVFMNRIIFERIFMQKPTTQSIQTEINGNLEVLTVTLGAKGSITATQDAIFQTPAFEVESIDTTGAGDAYAAGFIHYYCKKLPLTEVAKRAAVCAALQITQAGARAGLPIASEVEDFIKRCKK